MPTWLGWLVLVWAVAAMVLTLLVSRSLRAIGDWGVDGDPGGTRRPAAHDGMASAGPRVGFGPRG